MLADYQPQDWYTKIPSYQADAIAYLIYSVGQVIRTMPDGYEQAYPNLVLKASWRRCVEALGGQIANPS